MAGALLSGCARPELGGWSPPNGEVAVRSGNLELRAAPASGPAGQLIQLTVTVGGPARFEVGCVDSVHLWALDARGSRVWEQPVPELRCMAFGVRELSPGEQASFQVGWPTSPRLARGRYSIHGLFLFVGMPRPAENVPVLTVDISG